MPFQLIPYHRHGLQVIVDTINFHYHHGASLVQTKDFISGTGVKTDIPLENNQIKDFLKLCSQAWLKLHSIVAIKPQLNQASAGDRGDPVGTLLKFIKSYKRPVVTIRQLHASRLEQLARAFFFHFQTGDYVDRHFLFCTASQKLAS